MKLVLLGGGGHASDVLGLLEDLNRLLGKSLPEIAIGDDYWENRSRFENRNVKLIHGIDNAISWGSHFIATAGYPSPRRLIAERAIQAGLHAFEAIVHPTANLNLERVRIKEGSIMLGMCSVSPLATIGEHCYISHGTLIGHDTVIGDFSTLMPGVSISGDVRIGTGVLVGAGAIVLEKLTVGDNARIGAGAVVTKDVKAGTTVTGIPAKARVDYNSNRVC